MDGIWIAWLAFTALSFGLLEWLTWRKHATLSETLRRWLGIDPPKPWRRASVVIFTSAMLAFVGWFVPHIVG